MLRIICVTENDRNKRANPCHALNVAAVKGEISLTVAASHSYDDLLYGTHFDALILRKTQTQAKTVRQIHAHYPHLPILVLIDNSLPAGIADLLDAGADDCQTSSIQSVELMARLRAIIRRTNRTEETDIHMGRLVLHEGEKTLTLDQKPINFTPKEYALVAFLMKRARQPSTKDDILQHLYPLGDLPETKTVDVLLYRARKKFLQNNIKKPFIAQWGAGWKINTQAFKQPDHFQQSEPETEQRKETSIPITGKISMVAHDD